MRRASGSGPRATVPRSVFRSAAPCTRRRGEQAELSRPRDSVRAVVDAELRVQMTHVGPYRVDRHEQLGCDLGYLQVGRQVLQDPELAGGQRFVERLRVLGAAGRRMSGPKIEDLGDQ